MLNFYDELYVQLTPKPIHHDGPLEENRPVHALACQAPAPWAQASLAEEETLLDAGLVYPYQDEQPPTQVVIVDTWVDIDHEELKGRASRAPAFASGTSEWHGTHVAALVAGKTFGVNKNASIVSVQVLGDGGYGTWATILAGLDWVAKNLKPSIINMSIGGPRSRIIDDAVNLMVRHGWKIVVAAGNDGRDACETSPAGAEDVIAVGAHDRYRRWAPFSNHGKCVNIVAPGVNVTSAYPGNMEAIGSGTSMASPIVAGLWSLVPAMSAQSFLSLFGQTCLLSGVPANTGNSMASCAKAGLCQRSWCPAQRVAGEFTASQHCYALQCSLCY